jgi:hypothetical protein
MLKIKSYRDLRTTYCTTARIVTNSYRPTPGGILLSLMWRSDRIFVRVLQAIFQVVTALNFWVVTSYAVASDYQGFGRTVSHPYSLRDNWMRSTRKEKSPQVTVLKFLFHLFGRPCGDSLVSA